MSNLKRIYVFDAYGTLFKVNSTNLELSEEQQLIANKVQEIWRIKQLEYTWLTSLMGKWRNFSELTTAALDYALAHYQINNQNLRERLLGIYQSPTVFDDVKPFLSLAKSKNISTAILSNGVKKQLESSASLTGIDQFLQEYLSASDVKKYKPSPSVYQMVLSSFHCSAREVTFFSSNAWDICGASSFGFNTVWVNRNDQVFEKLGPTPQTIIKSLVEFSV